VLLPSSLLLTASAHSGWRDNPCGSGFDFAVPGTRGLYSTAGGTLVYDANLGVCWLADANLASNPFVRSVLGVGGINPDGTMDYPTAVNWVAALNAFDGGAGLFGHNNWQLPATPHTDGTCSSRNDANFGISCAASALGSLYNVGLARPYPETVAPGFVSLVWPFFDLQPGLYWTSSSDSTDDGEGGQSTFSFNTGLRGANTTTYNFLHVLPMTADLLGPVPAGTGVLPYTSGPGAWKAVYDSHTGLSWPLDANLAARRKFGVTGRTDIPSSVNGRTYHVPLVDDDGAMLYAAADPTASDGWIAGLNAGNYAGSHAWTLPGIDDINKLYNHLVMQVGDPRLEFRGFAGPFFALQPGFYWSCEREDGPDLNAPCGPPDLHPGFAHGPNHTPMYFSFNFDDGFEGTDKQDKLFYVMVYFPAPAR
jgi:hypothetical protein